MTPITQSILIALLAIAPVVGALCVYAGAGLAWRLTKGQPPIPRIAWGKGRVEMVKDEEDEQPKPRRMRA